MFLGGAYDDAAIQGMRDAVGKSKSTQGLVWLRPDMDKPAPPLGPEYGKAMVGRIKERMEELSRDGKLDGDDVFWY